MIVTPIEHLLHVGRRAANGASCCFLSLLVITVFSCSEDDGVEPTPPPPAPDIIALDATVLAVGDTLGISGSKFNPTPSANRIAFNNPLANPAPFFASADSLAVVVPAWANSGPLRVTTGGVSSNPVSVEIVRGIGDVWVVGLGAQLKLPDTGNEEYVMIVHSASTLGGANYNYSVDPETTSVFPLRAPSEPSSESSSETVNLPIEFEQSIRRQAIEYIEAHAGGAPPLKMARAQAAPAATVDFWVLRCTNCSTSSSSSYVRVTANLRYTGNNVLIYSDMNQPSGSFVQGDYDMYGAQFDSQIFPTDTIYFGPPTDIDNNDRVIVLFTPRVNDLTPDGTAGQGVITGFFLVNDLAPNYFPQTSNGSEIFYAMVPDPNGEWGNTIPKSAVQGFIPATLAHELEHMISYGYRFIVLGNGNNIYLGQDTWLEEGMAHVAEDLNGFTQSNANRASVYYLPDPGNVSLMGSDTLGQRGGIFLFLRYLGDQYGDAIFKSMVRTTAKGRDCVQGVTGVGFYTSVAEYLAALYLDDTGLSTNPKYEFTSNVDLSALLLAIKPRLVSEGAFSGSVRSAAGDFYEMTGIPNPATLFAVTGSSGSVLRIVIIKTS